MPAFTDPRWEAACQARAAGTEIGASYLAGGFRGKPAIATRFFQREDIRTRIAEIQSERYAQERIATAAATKKLALTKEWVLERLAYNAEQSLRGRPIRDKDGKITSYGKPNENAANRALELIGNTLGMFIQRHEIGQPGDFQRMSDDELDSALAEQARALGLPEIAVDRLLTLRKNDDESVQ